MNYASALSSQQTSPSSTRNSANTTTNLMSSWSRIQLSTQHSKPSTPHDTRRRQSCLQFDRSWGLRSMIRSESEIWIIMKNKQPYLASPPNLRQNYWTLLTSQVNCCPLAYGTSFTQLYPHCLAWFAVLGILLSLYDVIASWMRRLTATSNCFLHPS